MTLRTISTAFLLCVSAASMADDGLALLSFNVDNRQGSNDITLIQCSEADCRKDSQDLMGTIIGGQLGDGWRITTKHPSKKSVKTLLLVNTSDQQRCTVGLGEHGPFMMIKPIFDGDNDSTACAVTNLTN